MIFTATWKQNGGFNLRRESFRASHICFVQRDSVGKGQRSQSTRGRSKGEGRYLDEDGELFYCRPFIHSSFRFFLSSDAPSPCLCGVTRSVIRPPGRALSHIDRARSPPWLGDGRRRGRGWTLDAARCTHSFSKHVKSNVEFPAMRSGGLMLI